ncbi:hypothetical protein VPHD51_0197 [Vibrio phage D51]
MRYCGINCLKNYLGLVVQKKLDFCELRVANTPAPRASLSQTRKVNGMIGVVEFYQGLMGLNSFAISCMK